MLVCRVWQKYHKNSDNTRKFLFRKCLDCVPTAIFNTYIITLFNLYLSVRDFAARVLAKRTIRTFVGSSRVTIRHDVVGRKFKTCC